MRTVKQKPPHPEPRVFDKAARIPQNAKAAFLHIKEEEHKKLDEDGKPENYATRKVTEGTQKAVQKVLDNQRRLTRRTQNTIRQLRRSSKNTGKAVKAGGKAVKTSAQSAKATAKAAKIAAQTARKASVMAAKVAKTAVKATVQGIKLAVKAAITAAKALAAAIKGLIAAIAAGGWVVLVVILVIAAIAAILFSPYGIFYSSDTNETRTVAMVMSELNQELNNKIEGIRKEHPEATDVSISYEGSEDGTAILNGADILAVYAVRVGMDPDQPAEVVTLDDDKENTLRQIYGNMTHVSYTLVSQENDDTPLPTPGPAPTSSPQNIQLHINVDCKSYDEMIQFYSLNDQQVEVLEELMSPSNQQYFLALLNIPQPGGLTSEEIANIRNSLPSGLSILQSTVVDKALSLVGRVHYFWGGKSYVVGWDSRWGVPTKVTSGNSPTTGTIRPFGLDCSGFTSWVFINSGIPSDKISKVFGVGTSNQWRLSEPVQWNQAQIGDLAFFAIPGTRKGNHVGIVIGFNEDGKPMVVHCSSSRNNVVITEGWSTGFRFIRRPVII